MEKYIRLLVVGLLLSCCSHDEDIINPLPPTLELDGRLPMDNNGYYLCELNDSSFQTIHTISGTQVIHYIGMVSSESRMGE